VDIITQGILGAAVGFAVLGRKKPRTALSLGFLGGLAPDFDIFFAASDTVDYWVVHRGITHSLFFGPAVGLALAGTSVAFERWRQIGPQISYGVWYAFWALVLVTHPMLDAMTMYGTQLLAPFSSYPFAISGVSIIDPVYSLPLLFAIIYAFFSKTVERSMRWVQAMLVVTTAYLFLSWAQNPRAVALAEADLTASNTPFERIEAYTTIFSPWLQRVMATDKDGRFKVGFVSTLSPQPIRWQPLAYDAEAEALAKTVVDTPEGKVFHNFIRGPKVASFFTTEAGTRELRISDARYGFPGGQTLDGFWGIAFPLDAGGAIAGKGYRFMRPRGDDTQNIGALFRAKLGLEQDVI
jgi:inner membrane protein